MKVYCQENWKQKNKTKQNIAKPIKKTTKKHCKSIVKAFLKTRKLKKKTFANKKKEYRKNYYYKWKNLFNHLICLVEELGNVCLKR